MKMLFSISLESHQQAIRVFMHLHRFTHYCFGCCTSGQCSDYNSNEHSEKSQELFCSCGINIFCAIPQLKMLFIFHLLVFSKSKFELPGKQWFCGISLRQTSVPDPAGNILELSKKKMNQFFSFLTCLLETFQLVAVISSANFPVELPCMTKGKRKSSRILHSAVLHRNKEMEQEGESQPAALCYHWVTQAATVTSCLLCAQPSLLHLCQHS